MCIYFATLILLLLVIIRKAGIYESVRCQDIVLAFSFFKIFSHRLSPQNDPLYYYTTSAATISATYAFASVVVNM